MGKTTSDRRPAAPGSAAPHHATSVRAVSTPILASLMLTMVAFGGARIQAGSFDSAAPPADAQPGITTRTIEFTPASFQPAAFADWQEQQQR